jgi:hypothetical protein
MERQLSLPSFLSLSKSVDDWYGAAAVALVGVGTPRLRQIVTIVARVGWEVCDGAHRLIVMKKSAQREPNFQRTAAVPRFENRETWGTPVSSSADAD